MGKKLTKKEKVSAERSGLLQREVELQDQKNPYRFLGPENQKDFPETEKVS